MPAANAASQDGRAVFVTGWSRHHSAPADYLTVGYASATGRQLWVRSYAGPGKFFDEAAAIAVSPDARIVFVTGTSGIYQPGSDYLTIAYSASTGRQLWLRRHQVPDGFAYARALVVSPDGKTVFVTGYSGGGSYGPRNYDAYTTIAYDAATGAQRWISRLTGRAHGNNQARNIAISPGGSTVYVTGRGYGPASRYDDLTVAYDAATGARRWASRYNGPANGNDFANAVAVAPDGTSVYVTGGSRNGRSSDTPIHVATVAYNAATGAQQWAARSSGSGSGGSLAVTPDGRSVVVAGPGIGTGLNAYSAVVYHAATGAVGWTHRVLELPCCSISSSQTLAVSPDSSTIYLTGATAGNCCKSGTVAYAVASGRRLWQRTYNGPGSGGHWSGVLALSLDGRSLYVSGESVLGNTSGFATIAYRT